MNSKEEETDNIENLTKFNQMDYMYSINTMLEVGLFDKTLGLCSSLVDYHEFYYQKHLADSEDPDGFIQYLYQKRNEVNKIDKHAEFLYGLHYLANAANDIVPSNSNNIISLEFDKNFKKNFRQLTKKNEGLHVSVKKHSIKIYCRILDKQQTQYGYFCPNQGLWQNLSFNEMYNIFVLDIKKYGTRSALGASNVVIFENAKARIQRYFAPANITFDKTNLNLGKKKFANILPLVFAANKTPVHYIEIGKTISYYEKDLICLSRLAAIFAFSKDETLINQLKHVEATYTKDLPMGLEAYSDYAKTNAKFDNLLLGISKSILTYIYIENKLPNSINQLCNLLNKNTSVHTLSICSSRGGSFFMPQLAETFKHNKSIQTLTLCESELGSSPSAYLNDILKYATNLRYLSLRQTDFIYRHLKKSTEYFIGSHLSYLDLSANGLGKKAAILLSRIIRENKTIFSLDLKENELGDESFINIAEATAKNSTLKMLNLSSNLASDEGLNAVATMLKSNTTLTDINLGSNIFSDKNFTDFIRSLQQNNSIKTLSIVFDSFADDNASELIKVLNKNSTLQTIDLYEDEVSSALLYQIKDKLEENEKINRIQPIKPIKKARSSNYTFSENKAKSPSSTIGFPFIIEEKSTNLLTIKN